MKTIGKKFLATVLASALLVGGGAVVLKQSAFADSAPAAAQASTSAAAKVNASSSKHQVDRWKGALQPYSLAKETATVLGTDVKTIVTELKSGKTLAQIAQEKSNMNEDTLVQKLTDSISQKLDAAVKSGKVKQAKADKLKTNLSNRLKKAVERTIKFPKPNHSPADLKQLASYLNLSQTDLRAKLKSGESLADIAQGQNITEDALIAKIKDGMTDRIKKFVEHKQKPAAAANQTAPAPAPTTAQ